TVTLVIRFFVCSSECESAAAWDDQQNSCCTNLRYGRRTERVMSGDANAKMLTVYLLIFVISLARRAAIVPRLAEKKQVRYTITPRSSHFLPTRFEYKSIAQ
ncbi:hypothetical protein PMAYCL1PPCAC_16412, partial [Pristionchus mayeri]